MEQLLTLIKSICAMVVGLVLVIVEPLVVLVTPRSRRRHDVKGKIVLITGGGSGIGQKVAQRLAQLGAKIVSWDVNSAGNATTAKLIKDNAGFCKTYTLDLCDRGAIYRTARQVKEEVGVVDILLNNAGIINGKEFLECTDDMILRTFNVNILSYMWTCRAFLPDMMKSNSGQIISIASIAGFFGNRRTVDYCASKFAVVGFEESLADELRHDGYHGISLTLVCPYLINTGLFEGATSSLVPILEPDYVADEITDAILMKSRQLIMPFFMKIAIALKGVLTVRGSILSHRAFGNPAMMDGFTGRKKGK